MHITRGKIPCAKKICIYGPEGIGKSTFASYFPDPVFIDTEGSTKNMDVARFDKPSSWTMLLEMVRYVRDTQGVCKTLVIDTLDWAEAMCIEHVCATYQKKSLEAFGYGSGYVYEKEEFGRFLNLLEEVVNRGVHVVLTAHAQIRKFEQPDEMGAYDRYELKLGKKTSSQIAPLIKEFVDILLFANYKIYSVSTENNKKKAQGGSRVMYTQHHPCWDAKNRHGLPDELPFEYAQIAHILDDKPGTVTAEPPQEVKKPVREPVKEPVRETAKEVTPQVPVQQTIEIQPEPAESRQEPPSSKNDEIDTSDIGKAMKALRELMMHYFVEDSDVQAAVSAKGYYPIDTPIENYDPGFIWGVLITAWDQVYAMIQQSKGLNNEDCPF